MIEFGGGLYLLVRCMLAGLRWAERAPNRCRCLYILSYCMTHGIFDAIEFH